MGDLNAKVGRDWSSWEPVIGKFGLGEENDRGERLLNFCQNNDLVIMNTMFRQNKAETVDVAITGRTNKKSD